MCVHTFDNNSGSLRISLQSILENYFPSSDSSIQHSELLYDELMAGNKHCFYDKNESYILSYERGEGCLVVNIVCLHIESLSVHVSHGKDIISEESLTTFFSEVRILLLTEVISYQNNMFTKVSDNTWHLASGLSHEVVTQHVIEGALKTIAYSDAAIFRIYDDENGRLIPIAMSGFNNNYYDYVVSLHESISGKVFKNQQTAVLNSQEEIIHSFTSNSTLRDRILQDNPLATSLICVPVFDQLTCYGTLTMLSFSRQYVFNSLAKSLLETYSSQVALAWRNARIYDERSESLRMVEDLRSQLQAQNKLLNASVDLYNVMVSLSIKYSVLDDFIVAIGKHISLDLNYIDVLGNQFLSEPNVGLTWDDISLLDKNNEGLIPLPGYEGYTIIPLENEGRLLAVFIIKKDAINEYHSSIIPRLKEFVIMEIAKQASSVMVDNKKNLDLVASIIATGFTPENEISLARRGIISPKYVSCLKLTHVNFSGSEIDYLSVINSVGRIFSTKNIFHFFNDDIVTLLSFDMSEQKLITVVDKIVANYQESTTYKIGVSSALRLKDIVTTIKQAGTALDVLKTREKNGVMSFRYCGIDRLLIKHNKSELKEFIFDILSKVIEDDNKPSILLTTIICYLSHSQSVASTASELGIHVNTLYQRIKKFESLTNLSLCKPDEFIMIALACHMSKYYLN